MITVRIPPTLRGEVGGARQVEAVGDTVREVLDDLVAQHPALGPQILANGDIAPFVNVYLGGEDVRTLNGLDTAVATRRHGDPAPCDGRRQLDAPWSPPVAASVLDLIGSTPLVELARLSPKPDVRLYAKLEGQNPTGSIKDRVAKAMIEAAEASGELEPGRALLEPTSGNTGIALAMIARLKGYPLTCVMPENATEERKRLLRLYGAEIVSSPAAEGSNGAVRLALELAERDPRWFVPFQYANQANVRAHYEGTGAEIAEALDRVDVLVAGLGTGGTLMGAGERLRESFPDVVVAAAEPLPGDPVMGLRSLDDGYVPPILDVTRLDRKVLVSNEESVSAVRELLRLEGILGGVSAGAVLHVARRLADELDEGVVVAVLADGGWKYLSADFWDAPDEGVESLDGVDRLVVIPAAVRSAIAEHARAELPNEACGLLLLEGDVAVEYVPGENASPVAVLLRAPPRPGRVGRHRRARRRAGGRPLPRLLPAAPVAHGRRADRALGGPAVRHLLGAHRRARRLAHRGRRRSSPCPTRPERSAGARLAGRLTVAEPSTAVARP